MSFSLWAQVARTRLIRPRLGSPLVLGRSFVLLTPKLSTNAVLRPIPLASRQLSAVAAELSREKTSPLVPPTELQQPEEQSGDATPFSSLEPFLDKRLMKAITGKPFHLETMTTVQSEVLKLLPQLVDPFDPERVKDSPRDLLVRARTGTGKTLAFLIPAVEARLRAIEAFVKKTTQDSGLTPTRDLIMSARKQFAGRHTGIVIISPTRELATQIAMEASKLTQHLDGFEVQLFVGGESRGNQLRSFKRGRHDIVVATPGRLRDYLESVELVAESISRTQTLILDEADTLLDMGFQPDIQAIQAYMPDKPERQTFLFSATVSPAIRLIARESLSKHHLYINCVSEDTSPVHAHIPQYHTILPSADHQIPHILRLLAHDQLTNPGNSKVILFLPTTKMTQLYSGLLRGIVQDTLPAGRNTRVYEIHSKRTMDSRTKASNLFRNDKSGASVLVTSDVSARGVDYPGVTRVIQVGIPSSAEQYIHRIGRTGRAGGTQGRGDLVLLPFEHGFVSWQMNKVPMKPLTVDDLTAQTAELAKAHDEDPNNFFGSKLPMLNSGPESNPRRRHLFSKTLVPVMDDIPRVTRQTIGLVEHEAVDETFMSLLGYYLGKATDMRAGKSDILEGCKLWATEGCGLPEAPRISPAFMARMGLDNPRKLLDSKKRGFREPRQNAWASRGARRESRERGDRRRVYEERGDGGRAYEERGDRGRAYEGRGDREHVYEERGDRRRVSEEWGGRRRVYGDRGDKRRVFEDQGDRKPIPWMKRGKVNK